jgi:REP element-mobilizing transposase RayT
MKNRKSLRLKNYDYSLNGFYYITILINQREKILGEIRNNNLEINLAGQIIKKWWHRINKKFQQVETHAFIIMPNHIHGIIEINNNSNHKYTANEYDKNPKGRQFTNNHNNNPKGRHMGLPLLAKIIQWFKTMTTNEYIKNVKQNKLQPFEKRLWQRNYYEHIIRNEESLNQISNYIITNPERSKED